MAGSDEGPLVRFARHFELVPDPPFTDRFWSDWGPIFYRGRTNGSARVLCIGSDPGPTERIAGRTLVGDAGQRVQGFLSKLGLTRSYLCLNAFAYAPVPSQATHGRRDAGRTGPATWRNRLYDMARSDALQAVVAFGRVAQSASTCGPAGRREIPLKQIPHPSSHDEQSLLRRVAAGDQRAADDRHARRRRDATRPNYGMSSRSPTTRPSPDRTFPSARRLLGRRRVASAPAGERTVGRPSPDDRHTLVWIAPTP